MARRIQEKIVGAFIGIRFRFFWQLIVAGRSSLGAW
jgi:hypothetical protein